VEQVEVEPELGGVIGVAGRERALGESAAEYVGCESKEVGGREWFRGRDLRLDLSGERGMSSRA
jgi:hypothetical protein